MTRTVTIKRLLFISLLLLFAASASAQLPIRQHGRAAQHVRPAVAAGNFKVGHARVAANTSAGTQAITITWADAGTHTPTAAIFYMIFASVDATANDHISVSHGAATSTSARWAAGTYAEDGGANSDTGKQSATDECILLLDPVNEDIEAEADFSSFSSNTVTIDWGVAPPTAYFVYVLAYAGTDAAIAGTYNPDDTVDNSINVTTLGESANFVYSVGVGTGFGDTHSTGSNSGQGFYSFDGTTARQAVIKHRNRDNQASGNLATRISATRAVVFPSSGQINVLGEYSNHTSGFTVTTRDGNANSNTRVGYLALSLPTGTDAYVGLLQSETSTGDKSYTDPGFTPQTICIGGSSSATLGLDTNGIDPDGLSFGCAISASSEFSVQWTDDDGAPTINNTSRTDQKIVYVRHTATTDTAVADFTSFDATGWTMDWTTATGRYFAYVAFEQ